MPTVPLLTAALYRRKPRRRRFSLDAAIDASGCNLPKSAVPRLLRRLSSRGFIDGYHGWLRKEYVSGFLDWTVYGRQSSLMSIHSDLIALTPDFVAHAQLDLNGSSVLRTIAETRYGTPVYGMDGGMTILPIYLRRPLYPPQSAHEQLAQLSDLGPQLQSIMGLLDLDRSGRTDLSWLPLPARRCRVLPGNDNVPFATQISGNGCRKTPYENLPPNPFPGSDPTETRG